MINSFSFKNYKAFKEGKIELRPISILLGANSVGKSSILQLLSMIKQTVNVDKKYKSALKLNGENVSLGENKNIFHNQKITTPFEITFEIKSSGLDKIRHELEDSIETILINLERIYTFLTQDNNRLEILFTKGQHRDCSILLKKIQSLKTKINNKLKTKNNDEDKEFFHKVFGYTYRKSISGVSAFYNKKENKIVLDLNHYKKAYELVDNLASLPKNSIFLTYQIILKRQDLKINKIEISTSNHVILGYSQYVNRIKHHLFSDVSNQADLDTYKSKFGNSIFLEKLDIFPKTVSVENLRKTAHHIKHNMTNVHENVFIETVYSIFKTAIRSMQDSFSSENINYVSPLRAFPKRYYFLDESNISSALNTIDGNQLTEILKEDKETKKLVNNWLNKFQLKVDVTNLADVIHNIKISQHGLNLDITDVGFGLSQVLPVIVQGFLSKADSLTIIEQPEIHLHPKMQADLADLFIDIVTIKEPDQRKQLLIETHSEYLLKRLRRRIAEGKISADDVAIYFVHPKDIKTKSGKIEEIKISQTGDFEWPVDFYSSDLEDTIEFLKYQK